MIAQLNELGITNMMITSTVITILLAVLSIVATHNMKLVPSGLQNVAEWSIEKLHGFFSDVMGPEKCKKYFPFIGTFFIYILICNYVGLLPLSGELPGLAAPTSSINFPIAMALIVFVGIQVVGIIEHRGFSFYKTLFKPFAFLFPLMLIEMMVKPLSLTLRLYGNIFGEESVTAEFFNMVPLGLPVIMQFLSVLMGLVQALVFALLCSIYWMEAAETEEEDRLPS